MVGWHHQLDRLEFEQALGVGEGQRSLACCSPWGCKELDTTEQLNSTETMKKVKAQGESSWVLKKSARWARQCLNLLRPSTDWMRPTPIMEGNLLYFKSTDLNVNLIQNTLTETPRIMFYRISCLGIWPIQVDTTKWLITWTLEQACFCPSRCALSGLF